MIRTSEPVTVGVPLPDRFADANSLTINAPAAQFRPLAYYPSGNVRWVLCDFQATVASGGSASVTLTDGGAGNFGGPDLAADNGATINVDTGVAQFRIRKANFNVFDGVVVNGKPLVSAPTGECIWWNGTTDEKYSSANDASSTAVIEENGPVRCCVKATGALRNASGARVVNFTMRMHFYTGKSYVRASLTVRNDDTTQFAPQWLHALEVKVPLAITSPTARLATKAGEVSQALTGTQRATLFQAFSVDKKADSAVYGGVGIWDPPLPWNGSDFTAKGLEIIAAGTTLNALGSQTDWTQGYADLSDASGAGCTVALRWMSAYWPAGFDLGADGTLSVELYSKRNPKPAMKLACAKHEWREFIFDFHTTAADPALTLARVETPLLARAPMQHYVDTGAIYGQTEFATADEQATIFAQAGHPEMFSVASFNAPQPVAVYRCWAWPQGSGTNQTDDPLDDLTDFLRGGPNTYFYRSYARTFFNKTAAWYVLPGQETQPPVYDPAAKDPTFWSGGMSVNGMNDCFNAAHFHMLSLPTTYFVTGNEEFKEAVDAIRRFYRRVMAGGGNFAKLDQYTDFRAWMRAHRNLALCYEFQQQTDKVADAAILNTLHAATDLVIDARDDPTKGTMSPPGRNLDRGYFYGDAALVSGLGFRTAHSLFHSQMFFEALWQVLRVYRAYGTYRDDEIEDVLEGLARFYMDEMLDDLSVPAPRSGDTDVGFFYDYALDSPYPAYATWGTLSKPWTATDGHPLWPFDASRAGLFAYCKTGNAAYLDRAINLVWRVRDFCGNAHNSSELQDQALMAAKFRAPKAWHELPLTVANGTISWSAPSGSVVRVKTSAKQIVDWLGYDRATQTYQHDPATHVPFFAAQTVAGAVSGMPAVAGANYAARVLQ